MDIIIGWQDYTTEFNGEAVSMQLRPLTRKGFLLLSPHMGIFQAYAKKEQVDGLAAQTGLFELQGVCRELFQTHLKGLVGFTVNGKEPRIEDLTEESVFATLCTDIVGRLFLISVLDRADSKNSEGQSISQIGSAP